MLEKIYSQTYRENTIQNIKDFNNSSFGCYYFTINGIKKIKNFIEVV